MNQPQQSLEQVRQVIERHWGYRSFRPLQEQAMQAALERPRFRRRHADRRRQVAVLPGPRHAARRHHRRRLAAHRPHEGPGRQPQGLRRPRHSD